MTDESSKKLIKLLTVISVILAIAYFGTIMAFVGGLFTSVVAFFVLLYFSITIFLESYSWFNLHVFNILMGGILIGAAINIITKLAFKLIPKSQLIKYTERRKLYKDSEDAIKLFTSSLKTDIDEIIKPLLKLTEIKRSTSIYEVFESEDLVNENKQKIGHAHYWLGYIYGSENYGKFDFNLAVKHFSKSTFNSHIELGKLYYHGGTNHVTTIDTTHANHSKAIKNLFSALNENRYEASTYIGLILRRGTVKNKIGFISVNYIDDDINSKKTENASLLTEAFNHFKIGSANNDISKFYLGAMCYLGEGCAQDYEMARTNLDESIPFFYDEEIRYLVDIYSKGKGTAVDFVKALTYSLVAIQFDSTLECQVIDFKSKLSDAQISDAYFNASAFVNNQIYIDYITKSSEFGCVRAKESLIDLYRYGFGDILDKDSKKALAYAYEASSMNSANAKNALAIMLENGEGTDKDVDEAIRLYKIASELGSSEASVNLAINFQYGIGVESDIELAKNYYLKAIQKDNHRAMLNLAYIYLRDKEIDSALELLTKITTEPSSSLSKEARSTLGQIYFDGELLKQDYALALENFKLAGDCSDTFGRLGYIYYFGYGTERDFNLAKIYLEQYLLNNDDGYHQYLLGWMYLHGEGTEVNLNKAIFYLEKSASKKMKDSIFILSDIYSGKFDLSYKDLVKSLKWLYFAVNNDFTEAYEKMKPLKENLSSEGIEKAQELANEI